MKNRTSLWLGLCLLLALCQQLTAQNNEEHVFSNVVLSKVNATLTLGDQVYSAGDAFECNNATLSKNTVGTVQHWYDDGYNELSDIKLMTVSDSILLVGGFYSESGDVLPLQAGPRILAFDLNGVKMFDALLPLEDDHLIDRSVKLIVNGEDQIVCKMGHELYWLSASGDFEMLRSYPSDEFVDLDPLNDSTMLVLDKEVLYWMNNSGEVVDQLALDSEAIDLYLGPNHIYVLTTDDFKVIDSPSLMQSYDLLATELTAIGVTGNEESLVFWGTDFSSDFDEVVEVDIASFEIKEKVRFEKENTTIANVEIVGDELVLSGETKANLENIRFGFIKKTELLAEPVFSQEDIALEDFQVTNKLDLIIQNLSVPEVTLYFYQALPMEFEFEVSNNGLDTLRSFTLYSNDPANFECADGRINIHYNNLSIPPEESMTFSSSTNFKFGDTTSPIVPTLTLGVFGPNYHFEDNLTNNIFDYDFPVSVEEPKRGHPFSIQLSPNPAQDFIQVQLSEQENLEELRFDIVDLQGKMVFQQNTALNNFIPQQINIQHLPPGLYFLNVSSTKRFSSKKFVIQR